MPPISDLYALIPRVWAEIRLGCLCRYTDGGDTPEEFAVWTARPEAGGATYAVCRQHLDRWLDAADEDPHREPTALAFATAEQVELVGRPPAAGEDLSLGDQLLMDDAARLGLVHRGDVATPSMLSRIAALVGHWPAGRLEGLVEQLPSPMPSSGTPLVPDEIPELARAMVRERYPDLDPSSGAAAARRWKRLVRLAEVVHEQQVAQASGEKSPTAVIAKSRGVAPATVRGWLHQANLESLTPAPQSRPR